MIVSTREPHSATPFEVRGLPGLFPCSTEEWSAATGLTLDDLEAHSDAVTIIDAPTPTPPHAAHTATADTTADIAPKVSRKAR